MNYDMVVSDFDGTLLKSDNTISPRTVEAIKAYQAAGGVFTISTGRMHASIEKRLPELGLRGLNIPLMSYQGCYTMFTETREVIRKTWFDNALVLKMLALAKKLDVYGHVYDFEHIYIEKTTEQSEAYCRMVNVEPVVAGDLKTFILKTEPLMPKILMLVERERMAEVSSAFDKAFGSRAHVVASSTRLLEAVPLTGGKGNGLEHTAHNLGIALSRVAAVGDQMNDLTMLARAGLGVAVGNAKDEVKKAARYITDTNDDDGVAKLLERIVSDPTF